MTLVLYILAAATLVIAMGLLEIAASGRLRHGQGWTPRTVTLGAAAIGLDPKPAELRTLLIVGALVHGGLTAPDNPGHTARRIARAVATAAADTDLGTDAPAAAASHDEASAL